MRNDQATFTQDFDQISITELETEVPARAEKNNFVFEPTTSEEWIPFGFAMCHALIVHEFPSAICSRTRFAAYLAVLWWQYGKADKAAHVVSHNQRETSL